MVQTVEGGNKSYNFSDDLLAELQNMLADIVASGRSVPGGASVEQITGTRTVAAGVQSVELAADNVSARIVGTDHPVVFICKATFEPTAA